MDPCLTRITNKFFSFEELVSTHDFDVFVTGRTERTFRCVIGTQQEKYQRRVGLEDPFFKEGESYKIYVSGIKSKTFKKQCDSRKKDTLGFH